VRRWLIVLVPIIVLGLAGPAAAQTTLDQVAQGLRRDPVYVDSGAERAITAAAADDLRARVRGAGTPIFVAVLPSSALAEAGGNPNQLAAQLAKQVGRSGTYAVIVGDSFRAGSDVLPTGTPAVLASAALAKQGDGTAAVLAAFVDSVKAQPARNSGSGPSSGNGNTSAATPAKSSDSGGVGSGTIVLLALLVAGGGGLFFWVRKRRRKKEKEAAEIEAAERRQLEAELSVLSEDVIALVRREQQNGTVLGCIVQYGGQTPLKLSLALTAAGAIS